MVGRAHVDGAVVLVDLDAEVVPDGGEVVWLGHVAQAVVLGEGEGVRWVSMVRKVVVVTSMASL